MKDLLVPGATANNKPSHKDKSTDVNQKKDDQLNVENAMHTEGSSIKVSISQDSLLHRSPQHKDKKGLTSSHITESSSLTEKSTTSDKKPSRKGSQLSERFHRYSSCCFHKV